MVSEGFFEAMGVPLRAAGRSVPSDRTGAEPVIVISRAWHAAVSRSAGRRPDALLADRQSPCHRRRWRRASGLGDGVHARPAYLRFGRRPIVLEWFAGMKRSCARTRSAIARGADARARLSLDPSMPPFNLRTLDDEVSRAGGRAALQRHDARRVRRRGARPGGRRRVRRDGLLRVAAHARDRRPHRAWRDRTQVLRMMLRDGVGVVAGGLCSGSWPRSGARAD